MSYPSLGIRLANQRVSYQFIAATFGLILLGSGFFGSAPVALADDDDDKRKKLKDLLEKLKGLIKKFKERHEREDHKYDGEKDKQDPKIKITFPKNKDNVSGPIVITGTASDKKSGIDKVQVKVDGGSYQDAIFSGGTWTFSASLSPGMHKVTAKAVDNANNSERDQVQFTVS